MQYSLGHPVTTNSVEALRKFDAAIDMHAPSPVRCKPRKPESVFGTYLASIASPLGALGILLLHATRLIALRFA